MLSQQLGLLDASTLRQQPLGAMRRTVSPPVSQTQHPECRHTALSDKDRNNGG